MTVAEGNLPGTEGKEAASPEIRTALRNLLRAARHLSQYPRGHPIATSATEGATASLSRCLRTYREITISLSGTSLLLNGAAVKNPSDAEARLVSDFRKRYIRSLTFRHGVTGEELLSLFRVLGEDPESLRQEGGAKKALGLPAGGALELTEMEYNRAVTISEAREKGLASRPIGEEGEIDVSTTQVKPVVGFEGIVDLIDEPEALARLLQGVPGFPWLEEIGLEDGSVEGGMGLGAASGTGGITGGRGVGMTLASEQLASLDLQAQRAVVVLGRLRDHLIQEGAQDGEVGHKLSRIIMALDASFRGRLFRTALEESEQGDVLSQAAEFMSEKELLEAVIPEPTFLVADTSERMRRALKRCGGGLAALAPLALEQLRQWSVPEQLYTNVVELIATEMERDESSASEPISLPFAPEQKGALSAEIISDLLASVQARPAAAARAEVLLELVEKEKDADRYRSLATPLESAAEEMLDFQLPALVRQIVEMFQAHANDSTGPEWRRRRASLALEELRKENVLVKVEAGLKGAPAEQVADLVFLLCLFGRAGAGRLAGILADEGQAHLHDAAAGGLASLAREVGAWLQELTASLPWTASAKVAARMAASGDESAVQQAAGMLHHRDWRVRRAVVGALGQARGRAVQLLVQALRDKDVDVRAVAAAHLANIGDPSTVEALLTLASHGGILAEDQALRERAVAGLGRIGEPATGALERILRQRSWIRRKAEVALSVAAAEALARIGTEEARAALARAAQDHAGAIRSACLQALAATESQVSRILERDT